MTEFDPFARPENLSSMSRWREINRLHRIFDGTQYDGRPDWWTGCHRAGEEPVPLRHRKPCIQEKLAAAATNQVVRFLFGDKRFPKLTVPSDEPAPEKDPETGEEMEVSFTPAEGELSSEQAKQLEAWLDDLVECAFLKPNIRALARMGVARRTGVAILELKDGEFRITIPRPHDCYARFRDNDPENEVERLVWCYQFDKEVTDDRGMPKAERWVFRREWDTTAVHIYDDVKARQDGMPLDWGTPKSTPHGLKFCPVVWVRNESEDASGIDGKSLYDGLEDDLESLDITLSRRHQGVLYFGSPQPWEAGVEEGDGPNGGSSGVGGYSAAEAPPTGMVAAKRNIGGDHVWTYQGKDVTVQLMETTGKAFETATLHVNDIRSRVLESMGVVLTSMADTVGRVTIGADMSAKFLALAHAPLIALVQEYRHTWWPRGLRTIVSMMMRMVVDLEGAAFNVPGTETIAPLLKTFYRDGKWQPHRIVPKWGAFFDPSQQEVSAKVESATKAVEARLIQHSTGVEAVAPDFGVEDTQAELEAIDQEREEAEQKALDAEARQNVAAHEALKTLGKTDDSQGARPGMGAGPKRDAEQGGRPQGGPDGNHARGSQSQPASR